MKCLLLAVCVKCFLSTLLLLVFCVYSWYHAYSVQPTTGLTTTSRDNHKLQVTITTSSEHHYDSRYGCMLVRMYVHTYVCMYVHTMTEPLVEWAQLFGLASMYELEFSKLYFVVILALYIA